MIEAIVEELEPKQELFAELDRITGGRRDPRHEHLGAVGHRDRGGRDEARARARHALLQPGAAAAARRGDPHRADGRRAVRDRATRSASGSARRRSAATTRPGFVVNRVLIPLLNDCVRVLDEARVTPEDLDTGMKNGAGWPMGPCELIDLVGIDVHVHASEALYEALREPRMAAPPRLVRMAQAGLLGRKSGAASSSTTSPRASRAPRAARSASRRPSLRPGQLAARRERADRLRVDLEQLRELLRCQDLARGRVVAEAEALARHVEAPAAPRRPVPAWDARARPRRG